MSLCTDLADGFALEKCLRTAVLATRIARSVSDAPAEILLPGAAFEDALVGAGLPPWFAALLTDFYVQVFAKGLVDRVTGDVRALLGRPPRDLETFARDLAAAFA